LPALVTELDGLVEVGAAGRPVTPSFQPDADERARLEALRHLQGGATAPAEAAQGDQISALLTQRRGADALALYDTLRVRSYPVLLLGAAAALQASQPTRAEHEARLALALNEGPEPLITIGRALIQQQRSAEAKQIFERTVSLYPEQSEAWVSLGWLAE